MVLQGYDDYNVARGSSPANDQDFDDDDDGNCRDANYAPGAAEDDKDEDIVPPSAKRMRTVAAAPNMVAQPAHFYQTTQAAERSAKRVTIDESRSFEIDDDAGIAYTVPSRVPGTFGRINREKGSTLPAYHKKVSHELDSDDEMMMAMRDRG